MQQISKPKISNWVSYIVLIVLGTLIFLVSSLFQNEAEPVSGEYHYSTFFRNNYTVLLNVIFCIVALAIGYFTRINPLAAGVSLFMVLPLTAIIEATVYKGSHNLIPFEFVMYLIMALPTIAAILIGRLMKTRSLKKLF